MNIEIYFIIIHYFHFVFVFVDYYFHLEENHVYLYKVVVHFEQLQYAFLLEDIFVIDNIDI
jgi:hypothetical protein